MEVEGGCGGGGGGGDEAHGGEAALVALRCELEKIREDMYLPRAYPASPPVSPARSRSESLAELPPCATAAVIASPGADEGSFRTMEVVEGEMTSMVEVEGEMVEVHKASAAVRALLEAELSALRAELAAGAGGIGGDSGAFDDAADDGESWEAPKSQLEPSPEPEPEESLLSLSPLPSDCLPPGCEPPPHSIKGGVRWDEPQRVIDDDNDGGGDVLGRCSGGRVASFWGRLLCGNFAGLY